MPKAPRKDQMRQLFMPEKHASPPPRRLQTSALSPVPTPAVAAPWVGQSMLFCEWLRLRGGHGC